MKTSNPLLIGAAVLVAVAGSANGFASVPSTPESARISTAIGAASPRTTAGHQQSFDRTVATNTASAAAAALAVASTLFLGQPAFADGGAEIGANSKITTGGASTLQSGRTIAITRGVNLDRSDFSKQNLKGVAFQQSIVRDSNFKGSNLVGSSFFDATLDGSNFEDADMSLSNVEMAQFNRANLHNTIMKEVYVSGATLFEGVADIEGSDWSDTFLRKDQQKYLCGHPTAKGTNPVTGVDTRDSLMCRD
eukprot:CAMPEP_0197187158 /NCGR_PEP_ID=MMETSP1423-20130617/15335_1 /TAXON_ID=476441 /ORGANISM="Pseudo-nitzschia heimii, Strain UNC1101" /LENGTH=249 /DNA_ID=CAMNT_0042638659 /DNA_START=163 /DNA_END=912 /DNA_ORIENTATION=+